MTGRPAETVARVEAYAKEQGLFRTDDSPEPRFNESLSLDLGRVVPSVAGPRRPQDRVPSPDRRTSAAPSRPACTPTTTGRPTSTRAGRRGRAVVERRPRSRSRPATHPRTPSAPRPTPGRSPASRHRPRPHTNHGDPLPGGGGGPRRRAGQAALRIGRDRRHHVLHQHQQPQRDGRRRAAGPERGRPRPADAGLGQDLARAGLAGGDRLPGRRGPDGAAAGAGFDLVGYGCTTCIGNSGPLAEPIAERRSTPTTWSAWRSCPATATSRGASIRRRGPATSPRRRWWWPSRSPGASTWT